MVKELWVFIKPAISAISFFLALGCGENPRFEDMFQHLIARPVPKSVKNIEGGGFTWQGTPFTFGSPRTTQEAPSGKAGRNALLVL